MYVDSYLEIFTTMYGWAFANIISSIIIGTGLVVVPFFVIIFKKWMDAKEQGMQAGGILSLLEAAQTRLVAALFVATTCFFSYSSLGNIDLVHQPKGTLLEPNPQEVSREKGTDSAMDTAMQDAKKGGISQVGNNVDGLDRVPLWWYSVMAMSSGINNAVRDGLSSFENPAREIQALAQLSTLEDNGLQNKAIAFRSQCWKEARRRYNERSGIQSGKPGALSAEANKILEIDKSDVTWIGSELYLTEQGFYDNIFLEDTSAFGSLTTTAAAGQNTGGAGNAVLHNPSCKEIWEGNGSYKGLLNEMAEHSPKAQDLISGLRNLWQKAGNKWASLVGSVHGKDKEVQIKSHAVRGMLARSTTSMNMTTNADSSDIGMYGASKGFDNAVASAAGAFGLTVQSLKGDMWRQPLLTGLPMAQALLLMGIYTFLPLAVFLSGYDLRALFLGTVALFTVKMFASMWTIAQWIDAKLVTSMYPDSLGHWIKLVERPDVAVLDGYKAQILNTLLVGLLVGLPMLWVSMMGWLGIRLGAASVALMAAAETTAKKSADTSAAAAGYVGKSFIPKPGKK